MPWQPLSQKPEADCVVLFYHANIEPELPDERFSTGYFLWCDSSQCCDGSWDWDDDVPEPTHWMQMPEPPPSQKDGEEPKPLPA